MKKPFLKFERLLETHIAFALSKGLKSFCASIPAYGSEKNYSKKINNR